MRYGGGLPVNQEPAEGLTPETVFDVRWALELVGRATQRLEREQAAKGKAQTFSILRPFLGAESTPGKFELRTSGTGVEPGSASLEKADPAPASALCSTP